MSDPEDSVPVAAPPWRDLSALAMKAQVAAAIFGEEAAPVKVGRYEILETLGVGGMGVVYAAWDESLGRRVALKLLPSHQMGSDRERARLVREALALARLSHPNVVTVYEAGEHEHGVFVAMELVEGVSLQKWQQQRVRTRRELVDVYLQAGHGLAAAHRAGLVHRDFKPANVLVGNDGRVRVVDFGLAQGPGLAAPTTSSTGRRLSARPVSPITRTGAIVGTPAYMAPEQLAGSEADARADQFSFCVALYEAFVGRRPYEVAVLRLASEREVPPPTKGSRRLPVLLRRALRRGLALEPQRRWHDMEALLQAIGADAAWRRRLWGVSGPVALGFGMAWLAGRGEPEMHEPAVERVCEAPDHGPAVDWSERKPRIAAAFEATRKPYRRAVWSVVERKLGERSQQWSDAYVRACEADGAERSAQIKNCLERQAVRFTAVLDRLEHVDGESIVNADAVAAILPPAYACLERAEIPEESFAPSIPTDTLSRFEAAMVSIAIGKYDDAQTQLAALLAMQPSDAPLRADLLLLQGEALRALGSYEPAKDALAEAQAIAGSDERGARAVLGQLELFIELEQVEATEVLSRLLEKLVRQLEHPPTLHADVLDALGRAKVVTDPKEAARLHHLALDEHAKVARPSDDYDVLETKRLLANALAEGGDMAGARATYETVQKALANTLGEEHPEYATVLFDLGLLAKDDRDLEAARILFQRARDIEIAAFGPDSTQAARTEVMQAETLLLLEEHQRAAKLAEHAWSVQSKLPARHSDRIAALRILATIEFHLEHYARSLELHRLLIDEAGANDAPDVLHNIAWLQCQVGECAEARRYIDQALVQIETHLLGEHEAVYEVLHLYILQTAALVALAEGEPEKARVLLAEVLREAPKHPGEEKLLAEAAAVAKRVRRRH